MLCRLTCAAFAAVSAMLLAALPACAQDVMATWDSIKPLPAPALKRWEIANGPGLRDASSRTRADMLTF